MECNATPLGGLALAPLTRALIKSMVKSKRQIHDVQVTFPESDWMRFAMSDLTQMLGQPVKLSHGPPNFELGATVGT